MSDTPVAQTSPSALLGGNRRRGPVSALLVANAVSLAGNQMTALAIPWFVLETTGSAARAGLVGFFTLLPTVLAALCGGAIVDRVGARRMSVVSDLLSGATIAAIPALHLANLLSFPALLALVFLGALLDVPGATARDALYPDLIALGRLRPERANGLYHAVSRSASLLGPPAAGILLGAAGATTVLWVDAASFAVSALLVGMAVPGRLRPTPPAPAGTAPPTGSASIVSEIHEGWRFLWRDRLLRTLALTVALTNLVDAPIAIALVVYVREDIGQPAALGLILAVFGASALGGSLLYGAIGHRLSRRSVYIAAFVGVAVPFWLLALTPPLPVALLASVLIGIAAGPINPILMTVRQERVPPVLRGRVFGAQRAIAWSAMPLGALAGGFLIETAGVGATFGIMAACYLAASLSLMVNPALRAMD